MFQKSKTKRKWVPTEKMHNLEEGKTFKCLSTACDGDVIVPAGTNEGTLIKHHCGTVGVLNHTHGQWSLTDEATSDASGQMIETETTRPPAKKRGRPAGSKNKSKTVATVVDTPPELKVDEADIKLMQAVESECPYPKDENGKFGMAGQKWCEDKFNERKAQPVVTTKAAKTKSTAIIKLSPEDIQVDDSFVAKAHEADKDAQDAFGEIMDASARPFWKWGEKLLEVERKCFYLGLGLKTFEEYLKVRFDKSRGTAYEAMGLNRKVKERLGLSARDTKSIPILSARILAKADEPKVTPEIIEAAKTMTHEEFALKYESVLVEANYIADGATGEPLDDAVVTPVKVHGFKKISPAVADVWANALAAATWKGNESLLDDKQFINEEDRALFVIAKAVDDQYGDEYSQFVNQKHQQEQAVVNAQAVDTGAEIGIEF